MRNLGISQNAVLAALSDRIQAAPGLEALSAALRGLGTAWIANVVDAWLSTESVRALAPTQVGLAAMFGVAGNKLPEMNEALRLAMRAAAELTQMRSNSAGDPRLVLLDALPVPLLADMVAGATEPASLDQFLSSLNGMPMHPAVSAALAARRIDILTAPIGEVARLLGTLAILDRSEAIAWFNAVGEQALVDRIPGEVAWASAATFENTSDGRVIRCDYNEIGLPGEDGTHDRVVGICEIALALSPRSDIAASAARAPNGEIVGFGGLSLAEKRIPRVSLPASALPEWNRRWLDAIAIRVAAPTYSEYLSQATQLLDRLTPALDRILNLIIRGKSVTDAQLVATNSVHDAARELRTPAISYSASTGQTSETSTASVSKLQNLLFAGSTEVCRRFHKLPEGAGAYIAWTADLIKGLDEIETQEPWELVGGVPATLEKMRELLIRVRTIAGDSAQGSVHPRIKFAAILSKVRPDNALRFVTTLVQQRMTKALNKLADSIGSALKDDGIEAEVHVAEDPDGILPWPPSKVLVVVPPTSHIEVERHATAVIAARSAVPAGIRLTVIPKVSGRALPARGATGYATLLPSPDEANAWIDQLHLSSFHPEVSPVLSLAIAKASALQSMDRLNLGASGRPHVELDTRERLEKEFASDCALLVAMVNDLDPEGPALVLSLLERVRSGEANFADAVQEFSVSQLPNDVMQELYGLQIALDDAEFERDRVEGYD